MNAGFFDIQCAQIGFTSLCDMLSKVLQPVQRVYFQSLELASASAPILVLKKCKTHLTTSIPQVVNVFRALEFESHWRHLFVLWKT
jgi:hypothetical protein